MLPSSFAHVLGLRQLLLLLPLILLLGSGVSAWAEGKKPTVCCRTSGGTRGGCLNLWAHLVLPGNRVNPGPASQIAFLQGVSAKPTGMIIRITTMNGQLISEHLLEPVPAGVTVLSLPLVTHSSVWESLPSCSPDRPPTRTFLDREYPQTNGPAQQIMGNLSRSCGGSVDTGELLAAFSLESLQLNLPAKLPVRCKKLSP